MEVYDESKGVQVRFAIITFALIAITVGAHAEYTASWYSVESCKREGTWQKYGGRMANGEVFDDRAHVCACWLFPLGTRLVVTNTDNGRSVGVVVTDRGPAKRLAARGRIIDLSKGAFGEIASLGRGVIPVTIRVARVRR